jgi:hypothetical protein
MQRAAEVLMPICSRILRATCGSEQLEFIGKISERRIIYERIRTKFKHCQIGQFCQKRQLQKLALVQCARRLQKIQLTCVHSGA